MIQRIDTHQHLLLPKRFRYPWVEGFPQLRGRFGLEEYMTASAECGIAGTVFMEVDVAAEQSGAEARHFCHLAEDPASRLLGVVASGRPEAPGFLEHLDGISHPALKGIRRVLHVVPDEVSRSAAFRGNVAALAPRGLTFDLCVRSDQLGLAAALADACPDTRFILDHCGGPNIGASRYDCWKTALAELARRPNIAVKISGLPVYASPGEATASVLRRWIECSINLFGWDRCLWGGDWPVCTLNAGLRQWCDVVDEVLAAETTGNLRKLFETNARAIYKL